MMNESTANKQQQQQPSSFSVDLDLLEKEIEARERARRAQAQPSSAQQPFSAASGGHQDDQLSGHIAGLGPASKGGGGGALGGGPAFVSHSTELDTLDEPIWDTIHRDLRILRAKFAQVLVPAGSGQKNGALRDWDLWGPLFICVVLSLLLQGTNRGPQFTQVFTLTFFGSVAVTMNIKLLGGKISFFQTLCLIGYCLLPCVFAALAVKVGAHLFLRASSLELAARVLATGGGLVWAIFASTSFLQGTQAENRKVLGYYPLFLFYVVVAWLVVTNA